MKFTSKPWSGTAPGGQTLQHIASNMSPASTRQLQSAIAVTMALITALLLLCLTLPDALSQPVQEIMGWCLAGAVGLLAVLSGMRLLQGLLDP